MNITIFYNILLTNCTKMPNWCDNIVDIICDIRLINLKIDLDPD